MFSKGISQLEKNSTLNFLRFFRYKMYIQYVEKLNLIFSFMYLSTKSTIIWNPCRIHKILIFFSSTFDYSKHILLFLSSIKAI